MQTEKEHRLYFDIMRILAAFLVIYNHREAFHAYMHIDGYLRWFYMPLAVISKLSVPLFFMISGALLLNKTESFSVVLRKRILRIFAVLFIFCALNFIMVNLDAFIDGDEYSFSLGKFLYQFLSSSIPGVGLYWFLYAYLGFLFCLPFLQHIAKHMSKQDFTALIVLHFILSSIIPMLNLAAYFLGLSPITISSSFSVPIASANFLFYPLIGYYLETHVNIQSIHKKHISKLSLCTLSAILLSCLCITYDGIVTGEYSQKFVALFDYIIAIFTFLGIKYIVVNVYPQFFRGKIASALNKIGSLTFGIYLLDPIFMFILLVKYMAFMESYWSTFAISVGWCVISMTCGSLITFILKKLPVFRNLL